MERDLKHCSKQYMKMAILKHEETFKQQVHELHRLYSVQKLLMSDMKNAEQGRQRAKTIRKSRNVDTEAGPNQPSYSYSDQRNPSCIFDLELPAKEYIGDEDGDKLLADEETNLELTLATGNSQNQIGQYTPPFTSDSGATFSSSSTETAGSKGNNDDWESFQQSNIAVRFQNERKSGFRTDEHGRKDGLNQPPWLYQCLSLNMA
ncbi:uncharacterized protein [Typha latifolia]|uniref:uncharacterized protein n=1 Tax=Typha latifolia TaxID=4733 RepID=UPI003C2EBB61